MDGVVNRPKRGPDMANSRVLGPVCGASLGTSFAVRLCAGSLGRDRGPQKNTGQNDERN